MRRSVCLCLLTIVLSSIALCIDSSADRYIAVSSDETMPSGVQPKLRLDTDHVNRVEFRVFKVGNPLKLLSALAHGNSVPIVMPVLLHGSSANFVPLIVNPAEGNPEVAKWTVDLPHRSARDTFATRTVRVPVTERGVYLVEASDGKHRVYTVVFVTDLVLTIQGSGRDMSAYMVDRHSGRAIAGCEVVATNIKTKHSIRYRTDQRGIAKLRLPSSDDEWLILANYDNNFAAITQWSDRSNHSQPTIYVYTDRPIYRPGDAVHFKAIVRSRSTGDYSVPRDVALRAIGNDPKGNTVFDNELKTSKMGTVSGEFALPADSHLGKYLLSVGTSGKDAARTSAYFEVQEYKKPEVDVRITVDNEQVLQGDELSAVVAGRYFFGEPAKDAGVDYSVYELAHPTSEPNVAEEQSGSLVARGYKLVTRGFGALDDKGFYRFKIGTTVSNEKHDSVYLIRIQVADEAGRVVGNSKSVVAKYSKLKLSASSDRYLYRKNDSAEFLISARDEAGPAKFVQFRLSVSTYDPTSRATRIVAEMEGKTNEKGEARIPFKLSEDGSYTVNVVAKDQLDRQVGALTQISVLGPQLAAYTASRDRSGEVRIFADQTQYSAGDEATLNLVSAVTNLDYLVTVECGDLLSRYRSKANGQIAQVSIPVTPTCAPNFYVHALAIKNGVEYSGRSELRSSLKHRALNIEIASPKEQIGPGEDAELILRATDSKGQPAISEVSIGVVDSSIYALKADATPDILTTFYPKTHSAIHRANSLKYWFGNGSSGIVGGVPGGVIGGVVGGILGNPFTQGAGFVEPRVRKTFSDTAYWIADATTDERGEARVKFRAPDTLTTWRTTARGVTADTEVGAATKDTISRKNLLVRLSSPRFLRVGDESQISVIVHNYLPTTKIAKVAVEVDGLDILSGATQQTEVPSGGDARVNWTVKATQPTTAKILAKALTDEESDAIEVTLPIRPVGVKAHFGASGVMLSEGKVQFPVVFPSSSERSTRLVSIELTQTIAGASLSALEYLTTYPHGCTEQTLSSFLPSVAVQSALNETGVNSDVNKSELQKKVNAGLARLYNYQHPTGAWGWWETDADNIYMTAYVVAGLGAAKHAGYRVREEVLRQGRDWLVANFNAPIYPDARAYVLYALSISKPEPVLANRVWEKRESLSIYGISLLGLALQNAKDPRSGQLLAVVEHASQSSGPHAYWELDRDPLLDVRYGNNNVEATASAVQFLAEANPHSPLLPKAVAWLVTKRDQGQHWQSTKQTANVLFGLAAFFRQTKELTGTSNGDVYVNGSKMGSYTFSPTKHDRVILQIPASELSKSENSIEITNSGSGRVYWSWSGEFFSSSAVETVAKPAGLSIQREYFKLSRSKIDPSWTTVLATLKSGLPYNREPLAGHVQRGDLIGVRVSVFGHEWDYLMVEDPIPAGAELLESTSSLRGAFDFKPDYVAHEFHDDRASFFKTHFNGSGEFVYFLRVTNAGEFGISPASAEPMYLPGVQATTHVNRMKIK